MESKKDGKPLRFHDLGLEGFPVFVTDPVGAGLDAQFNSFDDKLLLQGVETRWAPGGDEPTIADLKLLSPEQLDAIIEAGGIEPLPLSLIEDIPDIKQDHQ